MVSLYGLEGLGFRVEVLQNSALTYPTLLRAEGHLEIWGNSRQLLLGTAGENQWHNEMDNDMDTVVIYVCIYTHIHNLNNR